MVAIKYAARLDIADFTGATPSARAFALDIETGCFPAAKNHTNVIEINERSAAKAARIISSGVTRQTSQGANFQPNNSWVTRNVTTIM
jgi:hypothetical protein